MTRILPRLTADRDTRLTILGVATLLVLLGVGLLAVIYGPQLLAGTTAAQEVRDGNELDACRAQWRGDVDMARAGLAVAAAEHEVLLSEGLEAVAVSGTGAAVAVLEELRVARDGVLVAAARVSATAEAFQLAAQESREDPSGFLGRCRERAQVSQLTGGARPGG